MFSVQSVVFLSSFTSDSLLNNHPNSVHSRVQILKKDCLKKVNPNALRTSVSGVFQGGILVKDNRVHTMRH
jgi:hypothetical protein